MFLQDADFESDADLAVLQAKLDQIRSFTAALFLKMYQCQRNQNSSDPQTNKRATLLTEIQSIQTDLLLLFKIRQG